MCKRGRRIVVFRVDQNSIQLQNRHSQQNLLKMSWSVVHESVLQEKEVIFAEEEEKRKIRNK
jgi:hypothetical protein